VERYMSLYSDLYGVKTVCLRISNPYGVGQDHRRPHGAIGVFLDRIATGKKISIWGDGTIIRDYIFISDLLRAFISAAKYDGTYKIFNIGSGVGSSLNELLQKLSSVTNKTTEIEYLPKREFDVHKNVLSIDLAAREMGWVPQYTLEMGLEMLCRHTLLTQCSH
jgi:UDP-glucose 4-epimerase